MADYELYCFKQSGNAYKAALMLSLSSANWTPEFVDFFNGETKTETFKKLNPMGEVPVLIHADTVISQSGVILNYLCKNLNQFGPENEHEEREILRWLLFDNHKLTSYCATLRFLRIFTDQPENDVTHFFELRAKNSLRILNEHLSGTAFVVGNKPTIADLSLCGYLYFPEEIGFSFAPYPELQRWLKDISNLDGWAHPYDLMPDQPPS